MMELLLIRHGKAQDREMVKTDRERKLVPKGILQLKQDIPYLAKYLKKRNNVYLWSSGVIRAIETAEIIKKICKIDKIEVHGFIETGDFEGLAQHFKKMAKDSTIIIVGHQPDLTDWTRLISEKTIGFKKGAAVSFKINLTDKLVGEINWIAEPGDYEKISI
ncbi:MAG: SixA phosphatase family protein [Acetobacterium sp.]